MTVAGSSETHNRPGIDPRMVAAVLEHYEAICRAQWPQFGGWVRA